MVINQGNPKHIYKFIIYEPIIEDVANSVFLFFAAILAFNTSKSSKIFKPEILPAQLAIVRPTKACPTYTTSTTSSTV